MTEPAELPQPRADDPIRLATPRFDDVEAKRARAAVASRIFGGPKQPVHVGRYQVQGRIGKGGMGVVYRAHDPELDRDVAVKLMNPESVGDTETATARARLVREARAMARLAHPNVIHVYDVGAVEDGVFIAMELVDGESLATRIAGGELDWHDILRMYIAAGRGLAAAHGAGIVHRDFKPENVLVGSDGRVRVGDFGLAGAPTPLEGGSGEELPPDTSALADTPVAASLTRTGALLGTPKYMAPELERGELASARSDQFSFCVALYEALYGRPPFDGTTVARYRREVRAGRVVAPPFDTKVKPWVHAEIIRGLAADPAQRHPGLGVLLDRLGDALVDPAVARSWWRRTVVLGPLLAAAVGVGVLVGSRSGELEPATLDTGDAIASADPEPLQSREPADDDRPVIPDAAPPSRVPTEGARGPSVPAGATDRGGPQAPEPAAKAPPRGASRDGGLTHERGRKHCYFHEDEKTRVGTSAKRETMILGDQDQCYRCRRTKDAWMIDTLEPKTDCGQFYLCQKEDDEACTPAAPE